MHKFNEPIDKSTYVPDSFAAMDANDIDYIDAFHFNCMHFDDEDDYIDNDQRINYVHEERTNSAAPLVAGAGAAATAAPRNQFPSQGNNNNPYQIKLSSE